MEASSKYEERDLALPSSLRTYTTDIIRLRRHILHQEDDGLRQDAGWHVQEALAYLDLARIALRKATAIQMAIEHHENKRYKPECPDGGTCHHDCVKSCFRVSACEPLSGVFENNKWPDSVKTKHKS